MDFILLGDCCVKTFILCVTLLLPMPSHCSVFTQGNITVRYIFVCRENIDLTHQSQAKGRGGCCGIWTTILLAFDRGSRQQDMDSLKVSLSFLKMESRREDRCKREREREHLEKRDPCQTLRQHEGTGKSPEAGLRTHTQTDLHTCVHTNGNAHA